MANAMSIKPILAHRVSSLGILQQLVQRFIVLILLSMPRGQSVEHQSRTSPPFYACFRQDNEPKRLQFMRKVRRHRVS
ncbi:hypothetical protein BDP81DRAFT_440722 [Colletotrichum phormii]|uniref:Uncharacterized protein n=1 Tax=Colletotrichum phormii TaxID=359342 RepID=A0AAI9ZFN6_9PEZI|nr:uncharacterized protein BDP81DRAFT_440722 [Colletotrichum phormii]KAK1622735.1 hypothetical protein BDP81DRAFT_440722 [Colletotrichum phormii]